jgi:hypothetical protein
MGLADAIATEGLGSRGERSDECVMVGDCGADAVIRLRGQALREQPVFASQIGKPVLHFFFS